MTKAMIELAVRYGVQTHSEFVLFIQSYYKGVNNGKQ